MYTGKYKKITSNTPFKINRKPSQNTQMKNQSNDFHDLKIQYKSTQSPYPQVCHKQQLYNSNIIQRTSEIKELSDDELKNTESAPYTGVLSKHPAYHRIIKPRILRTIPQDVLKRFARNKRARNFNFYICKGQQLWISNNDSARADKDTGYDIIFDSYSDFRIIKRNSS